MYHDNPHAPRVCVWCGVTLTDGLPLLCAQHA